MLINGAYPSDLPDIKCIVVSSSVCGALMGLSLFGCGRQRVVYTRAPASSGSSQFSTHSALVEDASKQHRASSSISSRVSKRSPRRIRGSRVYPTQQIPVEAHNPNPRPNIFEYETRERAIRRELNQKLFVYCSLLQQHHQPPHFGLFFPFDGNCEFSWRSDLNETGRMDSTAPGL